MQQTPGSNKSKEMFCGHDGLPALSRPTFIGPPFLRTGQYYELGQHLSYAWLVYILFVLVAGDVMLNRKRLNCRCQLTDCRFEGGYRSLRDSQSHTGSKPQLT